MSVNLHQEYIDRLTEEIKNVVDIELGVVQVMGEELQNSLNSRFEKQSLPKTEAGDLYVSKTTVVVIGDKPANTFHSSFPKLDIIGKFQSKKYNFDVTVFAYESDDELVSMVHKEEFSEE